MREGKQWNIENKFVVTEREHIHDVSDFALDLMEWLSDDEKAVYGQLLGNSEGNG